MKCKNKVDPCWLLGSVKLEGDRVWLLLVEVAKHTCPMHVLRVWQSAAQSMARTLYGPCLHTECAVWQLRVCSCIHNQVHLPTAQDPRDCQTNWARIVTQNMLLLCLMGSCYYRKLQHAAAFLMRPNFLSIIRGDYVLPSAVRTLPICLAPHSAPHEQVLYLPGRALALVGSALRTPYSSSRRSSGLSYPSSSICSWASGQLQPIGSLATNSMQASFTCANPAAWKALNQNARPAMPMANQPRSSTQGS